MNTTRNATMNTNPPRVADDAAGGAATRPLAHAIALRLLTAKGADAAGLKGFVVTAGLAEAMVDVLEELTRRARGLRVEFEDLATSSRPVAEQAQVPTHPSPAQPPVPTHPGY